MMIQIVATAKTVEEAEALLKAGADRIYVGEARYGLRMKGDWNLDNIRKLTKLVHSYGKEVMIAVNNLMHNDQIATLPAYLRELKEIGVDMVTAGDPGAIKLIREFGIPYWYDAQTFVTSAKQIQFWVKRDAVGAIAARELTLIELEQVQARASQPIEVQVYGPTCIHHSKRPLVTNYFNEIEAPKLPAKHQEYYMVEPNDAQSQYPVYEDENGTHIFLTEDLNLIKHLPVLLKHHLHVWKLDGWHAGDEFVSVVKLFSDARLAMLNGRYDANDFDARLAAIHPQQFKLGTGMYLKQPEDIK